MPKKMMKAITTINQVGKGENIMKWMYCITHGQMEIVDIGEITGQPVHMVFVGSFKDPDVDWCEGPFATCPPPEMEDWDVVFANEDAIQDLLDWENNG